MKNARIKRRRGKPLGRYFLEVPGQTPDSGGQESSSDFKLRTILFQTIADYERKHLQCQKRDIYKERDFASSDTGSTTAQIHWEQFADSITSPLSRLVRKDRHELLKNVLEALSENDRQILTLRHFDGMSNQECAEVLEIDPKTASIRYVRALQRLKTQLTQLSEFRP